MDLGRYQSAPLNRYVNYKLIPVNIIPITDEGAAEFNELYSYFLSRKDLNKIVRTDSRGISITAEHFTGPMWDVRSNNGCVEITALLLEGMYRWQFRSVPKTEFKIFGATAFREFRRLLSDGGINLEDYAIDNGLEIKSTIQAPPVCLEREEYADRIYEPVHHIDRHSSYAAGLCNTHPEFRAVIDKIYADRKLKGKEINKAILNYSIGYMQSIDGCQARWAHLTRDAIHDNNQFIANLAERLRKDYIVLLYNTDGLWYADYKHLGPYHGDGEGKGLGEWSNDHMYCKLRIKSAGAYEYVEHDQYYPVVRGYTNLDRVKDRKDWVWGDIYKKETRVAIYQFDYKTGVQKYE